VKKPKKVEAKLKKALTTFSKEYSSLKKLVGSEAKDFNYNASSIACTRAMLNSVLGMIPIAEKNYHEHPTQSTAYSFTALSNMARELQNDIRSMVDLQAQVDHIVDNIIEPNLLLVVQNSINSIFEMRKKFKAKIESPKSRNALKHASDDYLQDHAASMQKIKDTIAKQLTNYLCERK
jgi:hypothetical protein